MTDLALDSAVSLAQLAKMCRAHGQTDEAERCEENARNTYLFAVTQFEAIKRISDFERRALRKKFTRAAVELQLEPLPKE